jgi:predicted nucleic acid-binding protein
MKFVVDTNAYSGAISYNEVSLKYMKAGNTVLMPIIVLAELKAGFEAGSQTKRNLMFLNQFLDDPDTGLLNITEKTTEIYAKIFAQLRLDGKAIGQNDIWIAALCIGNNLPLLTFDKGFTYVKGLKLVHKP